jgi:hypothetical protein
MGQRQGKQIQGKQIQGISDRMKGFPSAGTKEQILAWLKTKEPYTLVHHLEPETLPVEELRQLFFVNTPELSFFTTPPGLLQRLPYETVTTSIQNYHPETYKTRSIKIPDEILLQTFGKLPPYYANGTPTSITALEQFDWNVLQPLYPTVPTSLEFVDYNVQLRTPEQRQTVLDYYTGEITKAQEMFQQQEEEFRTTEDPIKKLEILINLLKLKSRTWPRGTNDPQFNMEEPALPKVQKMSNQRISVRLDGHFDSFRGGEEVGKNEGRLPNDSPQMVFARAVGGLIVYLMKQIPKEYILDRKNSDLFKELFHTYSTKLLYRSQDAVSITKHLEQVANFINEYLNYNFIVFDCDELSYKCSRGLEVVLAKDNKYRLVFTNVGMETTSIPNDTYQRILNTYFEKGGRRKTHKRKSKKKKSKSRRWQKQRMS